MANNDGVKAINIAAIFADIGSSVADIDNELNRLMDVYKGAKSSLQKIELGVSIVNLTCSKLGFMTLIINDDEFLAIDLASLIPVSNEILEFIEDMQDTAYLLDNELERLEALSLVMGARVKLYDTKVFFYRFVDLSSLSGGLGKLKL